MEEHYGGLDWADAREHFEETMDRADGSFHRVGAASNESFGMRYRFHAGLSLAFDHLRAARSDVPPVVFEVEAEGRSLRCELARAALGRDAVLAVVPLSGGPGFAVSIQSERGHEVTASLAAEALAKLGVVPSRWRMACAPRPGDSTGHEGGARWRP